MAQLSEKQIEQYADLLAERMKTLEGDWKKPWITVQNQPQNMDGRPYSAKGMNAFALSLDTAIHNYETPVYITFLRAKSEGIRINAGSTGTWVSFASKQYKDKETGGKISPEDYKQLSEEEKQKYEAYFFAKVTKVFNLDQTNIREARPELWDKIRSRVEGEKVEIDNGVSVPPLDHVIEGNKWIIPIKHSNETRAYYAPIEQFIHLPNKDLFLSKASYYGVAMHEMAHSTDVPLKRDSGMDKFSYAREELVAELTSSVSAANYGIAKELQENNVHYLKGWLSAIDKDPSFLREVVKDVHQASNFMIQEIDGKYAQKLEESQNIGTILEKDQTIVVGSILNKFNGLSEEFTDKKEFLSAIKAELLDQKLPPHLLEAKLHIEDPQLKDEVQKLYDKAYGEDRAKEAEWRKQEEAEKKREEEARQLEEKRKQEEEPILRRAALTAMYVAPALMTLDYLKKNELDDDPALSYLIESKEKGIPPKDIVLDAGQRSYEDIIRDSIRYQYPDLPLLPTTEQKREVVENFLSSSSVRLTQDSSISIDKPLVVNLSVQDSLDARSHLERSSVDFHTTEEAKPMLSYDALIRYREGLKIENTPENKRVVEELGLSATPIKDKLFVPIDGDPAVAKLLSSGIKVGVAYGVAELPVLKRESLEERITAKGITDEDNRSLLLSGGKIIAKDERGNDTVVFVDQQTNQVRTIAPQQLPLPDRVASLSLRSSDYHQLRTEGTVEIFDRATHLYHRVSLDLKESDNFKVEYKELASEKFKPTPTVESPDKEKIDYIALRGAQAITDIWGREALKQERESFLERYKVQEPYREYLDLKQKGEPGATIEQNDRIKEVFREQQRKESKGISL